MNDGIIYDIGAFARELTWGLMAWNGAEFSAKMMLVSMLGDTKAALAVASDMGNRSVLEGIGAASRELDDPVTKDHLAHFCKGFGVLLGYRNLYIHNLRAVMMGGRTGNRIDLVGYVVQLKGGGRLKSIQQIVGLSDIVAFRNNADELNRYGAAILSKMGMSDLGLARMFRVAEPSLDKPSWLASLQNTPDYLQE